jgi:hypothetical protein
MDHGTYRKVMVSMSRLPEMVRRLRRLEKETASLRARLGQEGEDDGSD